jgi:hypothetical protein
MRSSIVRFVAAACLLVGLVGCSGGGGSLNSAAVTGTVTRGGKPVEGAMVSFVPQGQGARAAFGTTDASGRFSLTTLKPGDGAMPGLYGVTVEKASATAPASAPTPGLDPTTPEGMAAARAAYESSKATGNQSQKPTDLLPEKFKAVATSGLKADVQAAGGNDFTFDLKD